MSVLALLHISSAIRTEKIDLLITALRVTSRKLQDESHELEVESVLSENSKLHVWAIVSCDNENTRHKATLQLQYQAQQLSHYACELMALECLLSL